MPRKQAIWIVLLVSACGGCNNRVELPDDVGQRYAAVLCAAEAACGCQTYSSIDECESDVLAAFDRATVEVSKFDEDCFELMLANLEHRGCLYGADFPAACTAISGATKAGEACERDPRLWPVMRGGTCKSNALCNGVIGVCLTQYDNWDPVMEAGDPCEPLTLGSCGFSNLYCASDGRCAPRSEVGDACSDPYECDGASFCAMATGTCTPSLGISESCNPNDWRPCDYAMTSVGQSEAMWCNPESELCELGYPYLCSVLDYPFPS